MPNITVGFNTPVLVGDQEGPSYEPLSFSSEEPGVAEFDIFVGLLLLACFLIGGLGNTAAFVYFFRETGNTVMLVIYKFISFADIAKTILVLPMFLSYFCGRERMLFAGMVICTFWNITFTTIAQFSVFLVAVMSIVRNLYQINPERVISANAMVVMIILTGIGFFMLNLGPAIVWDLTSEFSPNHVTCGWFSAGGADNESISVEAANEFPYDLINVLFTIIPLALLIPTAISLGVNVYYLWKEAQQPARHHLQLDETGIQLATCSFAYTQSPAGNRHATVTIVIFTSAYLFFNAPLLLAFFIDAADGAVDRRLSVLPWDSPHFYFANYVYMLCLPFTSVANFFIFFTRMPRFRKGIEDKGKEGFSKVRPA